MVTLLAGGVALSGHSSKAAARLAVNHSPEPASNLAISLAEDAMAPLGIWLALKHPYIMLGVIAAFLALFGWLSPKVFRLVRLESSALVSLLRRLFGGRARPPAAVPEAYAGSPVGRLFFALAGRMGGARTGGAPLLRCAAGKNIKGLRHSIGYLLFDADRIVFETRRTFRRRSVELPLASVRDVQFRRGILLDRLTFQLVNGDRTFYIFKSSPVKAAQPAPAKRMPAAG